MFSITNAEIKVADSPNELHVVTLDYKLARKNELGGMIGKVKIQISDIWLARELFDTYKNENGN